ncbi:hypothetical protein [Lewinella sp. IMCC34183]|uniref:hypothetical protein n=1 Tax=Lewinella sp. IMCC34183 TaxID=2248762 RepID=UPI000E23486D|nr:hypothetical protein [Lewinella sp. IMCC34183]
MRNPFPLLLCLLLAISGFAQTYELDLSDQLVDLSGLSFRVDNVVDETGVTDGYYGRVYTGLLNKGRDLEFLFGPEQNLTALLLRNTVDRSLPPATLVLRFLRIDEEILNASERRRLQLEAILEQPDAEGNVLRYGPRQVAQFDGGLDVTGGHATALAAALVDVLHQLDADLRNGNTATEATAANGPLPDGAYYSVADYRAGRVDTTFNLILTERIPTRQEENLSFYTAEFDRPDTISRRDVRALWGYHHAGTDYLFLQRNFYSLQRDGDGQVFVAVPGGILDPEEMTKQGVRNAAVVSAFGLLGAVLMHPRDVYGSAEYFQLNGNSGALEPILGAGTVSGPVSDSIYLLNNSTFDHQILQVRLGDRQFVIPPGHYVAVTDGGLLELSADGASKPLAKKIWGTPGQPAVYSCSVTDRGKIALIRGSNESAQAAARSAASGTLRAAR